MEKTTHWENEKRYKKHDFLEQCVVYADQNFPSRKYMEDGLKIIY